MQPIELNQLSTVRGGFGALIGAALQAAPGILQGISGIIAASKSGGQQAAPAPAPAPAAPEPAPAPAPAASPCACACNPLGSTGSPSVSTMVKIG